MSSISKRQRHRLHGSAADLFQDRPPVLVEVRFPQSGTSPDWYLCEDLSELDAILATVGESAEIYLSSVWDLENRKGALQLR